MEAKFNPEYLSKDKALFAKYLDQYVNKFNTRIGYGTAGFRNAAQYLEHIAFRTGIFASYYAKLHKGNVVGIQITASHNPAVDNGIKIIGPDALMMKTHFEKIVEEFVNTEDLEVACKNLEDALVQVNDNKPIDWKETGFVLIGCDTRTSSPLLIGTLMEAITFNGSRYLNFGEITTPQLHFMVLVFNRDHKQYLPKFDYNTDKLLEVYYETFGGTILKAFDLLAEMGIFDKSKPKKKVFVDCANGVGGKQQERLSKEYLNQIFEVICINTHDLTHLNDECGSEFVQKEKKVPRGLLEYINNNIDPSENLDKMSFLSYDGDADRTVFYRVVRNQIEADLLEGDKMGALYAVFMLKTLNKIIELQKKLPQINLEEDFSKWTLGAVLTAYANGAAQQFFRESLKIPLMIEPTGVKNLHRAAENFDIGVYFESNGHGTVVYHQHKMHALEEVKQRAQEAHKADPNNKDLTELYQNIQLLHLFLTEANQGVGDAISNLLQIETAEAALQMDSSDFKALYNDLVSANSRIVVKNKSVIQVNYDNSRIITPIEIQNKIDEVCSKYPKARAFTRPSGTEDICRLYVEATTLEDVLEVEKQITEFVLNNKDVN